jgi:UDP-N-acetylglucosamine 2-epimerase
MSAIFKKLDNHFNHILVHTGQHYDELLSGVFFDDLEIRQPDYMLNAGGETNTHYHQLGYLSVAIIDLIEEHDLKPDMILFLGDSNSACAALPLKKEGYRIGHVEAGMRSGDKRMLEEMNRTVCDHCSDILFVYHEDYRTNLTRENITGNVHIVGNTIVEVCTPLLPVGDSLNILILVDIHRPENFKSQERMENILTYANKCANTYGLPVKMLKFPGTSKSVEEFQLDLGLVEMIDLLSYKKYLLMLHHCKFLISDSGTGQEEPALMQTPVIVPRDYTERPQSMKANASFMLDVNNLSNEKESIVWMEEIFCGKREIDASWLGDGDTADKIIHHLEIIL